MSSLTLTSDYSIELTLTGEDGIAVTVADATPALVLELTPIIGGGGSGVSGPAIYSFAASHG